MAAVQIPVALVSAIVFVVLYLTAFRDQPVYSLDEAVSEGARGQLFALLVLTAVEALFAQVARGATIVGAAAAAKGQRISLNAALDPAFSRMGPLLLMAVVIAGGAAALVFSLVGLVLLPFLALRLAISFEVLMLEGKGVWASFQRCWQLTRGHMLVLLGVILVVLVVVFLPLVAISLLSLTAGGPPTVEVLLLALVTLAQAVLTVPLLAFITAVTTTFYLNAKKAADG